MMTDFGRTMNPAGTGGVVGSDHAWGNHLFVIGDSVIGGDFYGVNTSNGTPFPNLLIDGPTMQHQTAQMPADVGFRRHRSNNMPQQLPVGTAYPKTRWQPYFRISEASRPQT